MSEGRASFGDVLRRLRSAASLSQEELAERAGLSRKGISDLERGARLVPRLETVRLLADALALGDADRTTLLTAARPALFRNAPAVAVPSSLGSLPRPLTRLIGREAELAALRAELQDDEVQLVTVTGPGGVGKTRLALAAARASQEAFADGVVFVPLAAVTDPALVLSAIAKALGVRETLERPLAEAVAAALHERCLLLVLDNFEHVLPAAADIAYLLEACPRLTVLVTSRAPLHLSGERRFLTPPLTLPAVSKRPAIDTLAGYAAIALFIERARSVQHDFTLGLGNADAVAEICRRLDGLPLAIELAAAWVQMLPPPELLRRLQHRLPLLHGGAEDQPVRLRTMRDAIAWSYDLLAEEEARLFRRLAVFVGGFTIEAAEWVAGSGLRVAGEPYPVLQSATRNLRTTTVDALSGLIDKSLLQPMIPEGPEPRFTMLETVREFALERLAESGEAPAIEAAHAASMLELAERLEPVLLGPEERRCHARLEAELGNLRTALAWGLVHDVATALRIGGALWAYWGLHHLAEARRWLTAALAQPSPADDLLRARALTTAGALACLLGDFAAGESAGRAAVTLAEAADDPMVEACARWIVGASRLSAGQPEGAMRELDRALWLFAQATTATDRGWAAYARWVRGVAALLLGERDEGLCCFEEALARARAVGTDAVTILILSDFAGWLFAFGETARARAMVQEALALAIDYGGSWLVSSPFIGLTLIDAAAGEAAIAARRLGAIEALLVSSGMVYPPHYQAHVDQAMALAKEALGEEAFAAAWAAGRADPGAVIAEALAHPGTSVAPTIGG